jgi:DNA-binding MarR family transcriptional regulator
MSNNIPDSFSYTLKKAQHLLRLKMDIALKAIKLTTPQYAVLSQLERQPGISNAALARASFVTAQTMHGIVSNLEKQGLITRKSDNHHGRKICTTLTSTGKNRLKKAHDLSQQATIAMLQPLSQDKQQQLQELLLECITSLEK